MSSRQQTSQNSSQKQQSQQSSGNNDQEIQEKVVIPYIIPMRQKINALTQKVNSIPIKIREQVLLASKATAVYVQSIGDVLASAADPKVPPVTQETYDVAVYLLKKRPELAQKIMELSDKIKDMPPEKRGIEIINLKSDSQQK